MSSDDAGGCQLRATIIIVDILAVVIVVASVNGHLTVIAAIYVAIISWVIAVWEICVIASGLDIW